MSYQNFKPTFWSKHIQKELEAKCTLADWCNTDFEGEAKHGAEVKIIGVGKPTIGDYVEGLGISDAETVSDMSMTMKIDQAKYFNIKIGDIDKVQAKKGVMEKLLDGAADGLSEIRDKYVGSLAKKSDYIDAAATTLTTEKSAKAAIDRAILNLRENNVPTATAVTIDIPFFMYQLLRDCLVDIKTNNDELVKKGIVGMYDNCYIRASNNLLVEDGIYYAMARTKQAIAFASGIDEVESYRPEKTFADAVKGLNTFGAKIIRPKELYVMKVQKN